MLKNLSAKKIYPRLSPGIYSGHITDAKDGPDGSIIINLVVDGKKLEPSKISDKSNGNGSALDYFVSVLASYVTVDSEDQAAHALTTIIKEKIEVKIIQTQYPNVTFADMTEEAMQEKIDDYLNKEKSKTVAPVIKKRA